MNYLANGKMCFDNVYEMYYNLFIEIGLAINYNQYLYDKDTGIELRFKDKYIKATIQPVEIYAGRNDIIFDPLNNYNLMITLLGYFIDKVNSDEESQHIEFIAHYTEELKEYEMQRVVIKTTSGDIYSNYYKNVNFGYIECIFILSGNTNYDLRNLDQVQY